VWGTQSRHTHRSRGDRVEMTAILVEIMLNCFGNAKPKVMRRFFYGSTFNCLYSQPLSSPSRCAGAFRSAFPRPELSSQLARATGTVRLASPSGPGIPAPTAVS